MKAKFWQFRPWDPRKLLLGLVALLTLGLLTDLQGLPSFGNRGGGQACHQIIQPKAVLSREQLAQFLTIPEGADQTRVRQVIKQPYCKLANLQVRAHALSDHEAYPLAFDPQTWLVVLYEGNQYVGYDFKVR
jgi:hypothetical protein